MRKKALMIFFGVLGWHFLFTGLRLSCLFDVYGYVDGLFMENVKDDLYQNALGMIALRVGSVCYGDTYIYSVNFSLGDSSEDEESVRLLNSLVDIGSWRATTDQSAVTVYSDINHYYYLFQNSDGIFIKATPRN